MQSGSRRSGSGSTPDDPPGPRTRVGRWILSYGLYAETLLGAVLVVMAVVTVVVVLVGAVTSLPTGPPPEGAERGTTGTSTLLEYGTQLINGSLLLALGLGALLVVHGAVELRTAVRTGSGLDAPRGADLAYVGIRAVQTVTAIAFVGPIVTGAALSGLGVAGDGPSNALLAVLFGSGLLMIASVLVHAVGRVAYSIVEG